MKIWQSKGKPGGNGIRRSVKKYFRSQVNAVGYWSGRSVKKRYRKFRGIFLRQSYKYFGAKMDEDVTKQGKTWR